MRCAHCSAIARPEAAYCAQCGKPLKPSARRVDERRPQRAGRQRAGPFGWLSTVLLGALGMFGVFGWMRFAASAPAPSPVQHVRPEPQYVPPALTNPPAGVAQPVADAEPAALAVAEEQTTPSRPVYLPPAPTQQPRRIWSVPPSGPVSAPRVFGRTEERDAYLRPCLPRAARDMKISDVDWDDARLKRVRGVLNDREIVVEFPERGEPRIRRD